MKFILKKSNLFLLLTGFSLLSFANSPSDFSNSSTQSFDFSSFQTNKNTVWPIVNGWYDQNIILGNWRTEYSLLKDKDTVRPDKPFIIKTNDKCLWEESFNNRPILTGASPPTDQKTCNIEEQQFLFSNHSFSNNYNFSSVNDPRFASWIVVANNEPSLLNKNKDIECWENDKLDPAGLNSGPPNQSFNIVKPHQGIFGLEKKPNEFRLVLNTKNFNSCKDNIDFIPFMGIGQQSGYTYPANNLPITYINSSGEYAKKLSFNVKINDLYSGPARRSIGSVNGIYLYIEGQWENHRRWLFIVLSARGSFDKNTNLNNLFNWNIKDTMYYPGADILFISSEKINEICATQIPSLNMKTNSQAQYNLDINHLFKCLSPRFLQPMPDDLVPITGIHFAIEHTSGANLTDVSFKNIKLN